MLTLSKKRKEDAARRASDPTLLPHRGSNNSKRVSIRDMLLRKEVPEMDQNLPSCCRVDFDDVNRLDVFQLSVTPEEGYWRGGKFVFSINVPEEYNIVPPIVKCNTRIWHPNISEDGKFVFSINVPEEYNIVPPIVKCNTRIWHPNISEDGKICLSLLREHSVDGTGWAPTRTMKDVIWGLSFLFTDLLNFDDPLNMEAAEHYQRNKSDFEAKVRHYVDRYAKR